MKSLYNKIIFLSVFCIFAIFTVDAQPFRHKNRNRKHEVTLTVPLKRTVKKTLPRNGKEAFIQRRLHWQNQVRQPKDIPILKSQLENSSFKTNSGKSSRKKIGKSKFIFWRKF